ncbi:MAG TPA: TIGR03087 family PEP-CTERM/XrtA system glycosyltransferase [Gemmataceae bacterium]|nr:TIGR03087 family PEP-CTERM/XrtA system glycosyltransferase [Gemmataceae bacterium]
MPASSLSNVLFLAHRVPYPPDKGDRIRTFHLLRFLSQRARVHLACLADEPVPDDTLLSLKRYCERVAIVPVGGWSRWFRVCFSLVRGGTASEGAFYVPELWGVLCRWANETRFDVSVASASSIASYLRLEELRGVPAVIDLMDVDSQKWFDYAASRRGARAWLYRTEGRRLRRLEQSISDWAHAVTLVGEAEVAIYRRFCPCGPVQAITNGVDLDYFQPTPPVGPASRRSEEPSCVFVGALDYLPNVEGSLWFCRKVWPEVRRRRPEAKLYLVGRRPNPAVQRLAGLPGVELVGQVPDVRPYLAGGALTVVPLQIARGVQNKVLESLAMARPTIASPQALAGLNAQPGAHLLQASSPEEWLQTILALFDDPTLAQRLGEAGRRYAEEHHCWERCLQSFAPLLGLPAEPVLSRRQDAFHLLAPIG